MIDSADSATPAPPSDPLADPCVHTLTLDSRTIYLIGTAHVSEQSATLVREVIEATKPDVVCLELCDSRMETIRDPEAWRNMDVIKVIREKKAFLLMLNFFLSSYQRRLAKQLGISPGQEMITGMQTAEAMGTRVEAIDRNVRVTLSRVWHSLGFWRKIKLYGQLMGAAFSTNEALTEEDIESLKEQDTLQLMLDEFGESLPEIKETLINERDRFMNQKLLETEGTPIVAVVGAGHVPGMKRNWGEPADLDELCEIPKKSAWRKLLPWIIPVLAVVGVTLGFLNNPEDGKERLEYWIWINVILAGIGGILACAHPLSIMVGAIASPITSLNPAIQAGMFAGLVEGWLRKPQVADFEKLGEDLSTTRGFWRNRVTRLLLVYLLVNLGSAIAGFIALPKILMN